METISTTNSPFFSLLSKFIAIDFELYNFETHHYINISNWNTCDKKFFKKEIAKNSNSIDLYFLDETSSYDVNASINEFLKIKNTYGEHILIITKALHSSISIHDSFIEISLKKQEQELVKILIEKLPDTIKELVEYHILEYYIYLKNKSISYKKIIDFLHGVLKSDFSKQSIGNLTYYLDLIPDANLLHNKNLIRNRLKLNFECTSILTNFKESIYNRISKLPIEFGDLQRALVTFIKKHPNLKTTFDFCSLIFEQQKNLNFSNWIIDELCNKDILSLPSEHVTPNYDLLIGSNKPTNQFGILGESLGGRKIAIDLSGTNTISLFGVQGGGKSYTIGTISEMVLKQFSHVSELPSPLAGVIFHYSESMEYEPEFTSMIYANDAKKELEKLKRVYGADPQKIDDVIILTPSDKVDERKEEYPSVEVLPIAFNSKELNVQDWMFMLGALSSDANYVKQLKAIAKQHRKNISINAIEQGVHESNLFTEFEKGLALQKLSFAREYIKENTEIGKLLKPGRLIIVDLRDEFIDKDEALGLFVIMLNIFSSVKKYNDIRFNKFIVFDEAHKYMDNKALTSNIVTMIREMRHKGVTIMIASQDPPSLPNEIIELSSVVLLHKFNSPNWLNHIKNSLTQLEILAPQDMNSLNPGEGYLWATKATEKGITYKPVKISARPRVTKHGGGTLQASKKEI